MMTTKIDVNLEQDHQFYVVIAFACKLKNFNCLKGVSTHKLWKMSCNFLIIIVTVVYIKKIFISEMEITQRIYFWYQNLLKMFLFCFVFEKMAKNHFFGK